MIKFFIDLLYVISYVVTNGLSSNFRDYVGAEIKPIEINKMSGVSLVNNNDTVTFGNEACKNCTTYVNNNVVQFKTLLKNNEESNYITVETCYKCVFLNLDAVGLYGDACRSLNPNNPNLTYTTFNVIWSNLSIQCDCGISATTLNPFTILKNEANSSFVSCANNNDTVVDVTATYDGLFDAILKPDFSNASCLSLSSSIKNLANLNYTLTMSWIDLILRLKLQDNSQIKGPRSIDIVESKVLSHNFSNVHAHCTTENPTVKICECLTESGVFITVMQQFMEVLFDCRTRTDDLKFKSVLKSYLFCDN